MLGCLRKMHEIITVQLGHHANFLGTHFWNTQVKSRRLHRSGTTTNQPARSPTSPTVRMLKRHLSTMTYTSAQESVLTELKHSHPEP